MNKSEIIFKREKPETDDFAINKYLVVKETYLVEISLFKEITKNFQVFS